MAPSDSQDSKPSHIRNVSHTSTYSHSSSPSNHNNTTVAPFSPSPSHSPLENRTQRSSVLIQQKSPLLVATPPQITRALAYSYPFIRPLNKLVALLSWTNDDSWECFLLVASFWATTLYSDFAIRWIGPLSAVGLLMFAMYARRFSLLSSNEWTGMKSRSTPKKSTSMQHNSLEDVVENLRLFTSRCNILLDPMLKLTDFLSTQTSATSATTRPALIAMFWRIALITPIWIILTLPPFYIITTRRVVMLVGTTILTWHSQPARVTRTIFWRSKLFRQICSVLTGLNLMGSIDSRLKTSLKGKSPHEIASALANKMEESQSIRFTFSIYENQRRWLGIGWTSSLLAYERSAWSDEHLNSTSPKEEFQLPEVTGGHTVWRWVEGSEWHVVDGNGKTINDLTSELGWTFYDNKWQNGRVGKDGWGRYTRRRKWVRDAELVEAPTEADLIQQDDTESNATTLVDRHQDNAVKSVTTGKEDDSAQSGSVKKRTGWFGVRRNSQPSSDKSTALSSTSVRSHADDEDDYHVPLRHKDSNHSRTWGVSDDAEMSLG